MIDGPGLSRRDFLKRAGAAEAVAQGAARQAVIVADDLAEQSYGFWKMLFVVRSSI